jgi:hypothetical protein
MTHKGQLIIVILLLFSFLLSYNPQRIEAAYGEVLFADDFSDGNDVGWVKQNEYGNTTNLWKIVDNKYGMLLYSRDTAGNSYLEGRDWTNISYEFDMYPLQGVDRNFIFRVVQTSDIPRGTYYYELHSSGNNITISKAAPNGSGPTYFTGSYYYPITNGDKYHWKIDLVGNNTKIYIKNSVDNINTLLFNITDNNMP